MAIARMNCAMHARRTLWVYCLALCASTISSASIPPLAANPSRPISIAVLHHSEMNSSAAERCEVSQPAEALATPDPLLGPSSSESTVAVSFVIGIDGRVHSPVILESAGSVEDTRVLQALRLWRYRPATCNAAPTEMESKVEFFSR
jgi:hypothetical protein